MKFFIPHAENDKQAEEVYGSIIKFVSSNLGGDICKRRFYSITYTDKGKIFTINIGEIEPHINEEVIAILKGKIYGICTKNRGVVRGIPILIGENEVISTEEFQ